ncbi:MAG: hypothetical protein ACKVT0_00520 [Planctomycetaceae bacterium]
MNSPTYSRLSQFPRLPAIAVPTSLLAVEILAITPFVEFRSGLMSYVADAAVLQTAMIAVIVALSFRKLATGENKSASFSGTAQAAPPPTIGSIAPANIRSTLSWLVIHAGLYALFAGLTIWWNQRQTLLDNDRLQIGVTAIWIGLVLSVGYSALRIIFTRERLLSELRIEPEGIAVAVICAALYAGFLPFRDEVWRATYRPTMYLAFWVMVQLQGAAVLSLSSEGWPIFGNPEVRLIVTPFCAGYEAIVMFWLWWLALWQAYRLDARDAERWMYRLLAGTALLLIVNAFRMDALIWLGQWREPTLSVRVAHSQWWTIIALGLSALLLKNPTAGRHE